MKPRPIALSLAAVCVLTALAGCAVPTAKTNPKPATRETTSTVLPGDQIAAHSFIDNQQGWAVGTDVGLGSLVLHTVDGGKHWTVLLRDDNGFPLVGVSFVDALHGWAVSSSGTLVGSIIATRDGGRTWVEQFGAGPMESVGFTDRLHGIVQGMDGNSPDQKPITLITSDGGLHWEIQPKK